MLLVVVRAHLWKSSSPVSGLLVGEWERRQTVTSRIGPFKDYGPHGCGVDTEPDDLQHSASFVFANGGEAVGITSNTRDFCISQLCHPDIVWLSSRYGKFEFGVLLQREPLFDFIKSAFASSLCGTGADAGIHEVLNHRGWKRPRWLNVAGWLGFVHCTCRT